MCVFAYVIFFNVLMSTNQRAQLLCIGLSPNVFSLSLSKMRARTHTNTHAHTPYVSVSLTRLLEKVNCQFASANIFIKTNINFLLIRTCELTSVTDN